jgi:hypothetical protein
MEHLTIFLLYSLRFLVIFAVILLWVVAMSQIGSHRSKGLFMTAELAFMAVAVSAVAVCVIAALNAVIPSRAWNEPSPRGGVVAATPTGKKCDAYSYTFTYSFGLRRPSSVPEDCMVGQTNNLRLETVDGRFARVYIPSYGKHVLACGVREGGRDGRGKFDCEI